TELAKDYPIHVVCRWIGNTALIAQKHYLQVTDADFAKATGQGGAKGAAESAAQALQKVTQHTAAQKHTIAQKSKKPPENRGFLQGGAASCASALVSGIPPRGLEPLAHFA